ncbi:condensation domain-containing protein [Streptomyces sp. NRRL F-5123]|uniref:condensation domain-containing protein n=1 Tax=Streptomyces sp. NRRL F-5123 TaxID=1463856 RepID=UPI0004E147DB|nr:condensation domain-containing protein [Streptomyces sp. NRRL F-5123]
MTGEPEAGGGVPERGSRDGAAPAVAERIPVDFAGEGEGEDEMSWGMWEIWQAMGRQRGPLPIGGRAALEPGTTLADLAAELRYLLERFPSMRTRLRIAPGGRALQRLSSTGRTTLEVYDAAPDADPEEVAAAVEQAYRSREFDFCAEWPVRMGVVRRDGVPVHLVTVMHHLATDALGGAIMLGQVRTRDTAPVSGMQQLEQARWQRSPAGQRQNARAMRHFESVLRTMPARQLPGPTDPREPRHWGAEFHSPALTAALPLIAARTGATVPGILLGLFATGLYRATGISPVIVRPVVGNRFRSALSDVVCMVAQAGVCAIHTAGASAADVVRRAGQGALTAYKHAYFDPEALDELVRRISVERGTDANIRTYLNVRSSYTLPADGTGAGTRELQEARGGTVFHWYTREENQTERLFVHVDDTPEGGLRFEIHIDTHYVSPAQAEAFAYGMEAAAIEAAVRDGAADEAAPQGAGEPVGAGGSAR